MKYAIKQKNTGFTIIELIVALAVLAILLTVGVPSVQELIKNNRVTGQTNELVAMINFARNEAIRRNSSVPVVLTSETDGWSGEVKDPSGTGSDPCTAMGALRCAEYNRVALTQDIDGSLDTVTLEFNNRGYLTPFEEVNIGLEHENCSSERQRRVIKILPTGQLSSEEAACSE